ncbi:hypothetical protein [Zunongwangia sp.]|uniref:hypothetical protein n=1 Tax=Zunongwangia sp. TaxID=1965325 RepID=UPI003AA99461
MILISLISACKNDVKIAKNESKIASDTINFNWLKLKQDGFTINHGAILIPVRIEGIDKTFNMQLDLGINHNVIFGDSLKVITSAYPQLKSNIQHREDYDIFYSKLKFSNNKSANGDSLFVLKNHGENGDFEDLDIIGTLGANEIKDKILIIDFSTQQLVITNKLENWEEKSFSFTPLSFKNNQIYIDLIAAGKKNAFIYTAQANLFPLTTVDRFLFNKLTTKNNEIKKLKSWNEEIKVIGGNITTAVKIADVNLPINNKNAFFINAENATKSLNTEHIQGVLGNDFFINNTIVIDLVNNRFGIK